MLKSMRKHARYFYVLFVIVILSFMFWGVGTVDKSPTVSVAEIGKDKITVEEYWRTYEKMREALREVYKGQLTEEIEKQLRIKETVLNSLIEERVLLISAAEMGIAVTDKELQEAITTDPRFMRDGVFRKEIYFRTLELNRLTPDMFESAARQQLTLLKMRRLIASVVDLNPLDVKGLSGDDKKARETMQALLTAKRDIAVKSYVDSMKKRMNVKVNMEHIS